ncbi:hypothetical protein Goari_023838, partial [Gossypium aridum]|nr:hypothetical protein [Gossypium aridum]
MVVWGEEPLGEYTARSGYRLLMALLTIVATILSIGRFGRLVGSAVCPKCARGVENLEHDFRDCPFVAEDIKSEERMYRDRQFAYVPRESNGTNHILAREGLKRAESINLGVYVLRFLVEVLDLDCQ